MSRDINANIITESKKENVRPFVLVKIVFDSGVVRTNSTDRNLSVDIDGDGIQTYLGIGEMGRISSVSDSAELQATGISLELTGIPSTHISTALNESYQGRDIKVWLGFFDNTYQIIVDPVEIFSGFVNTMNISIGETATVQLTAEHELVRWEEPNVRRYTNEDQQERFSGDKGLEFVNQTVEKELIWGRTGI